ncbi:hypothetical protein, partial [Streptomyces sp. NPDC059072]|uniref:hypothetical protein n=1 Tax=Streptomyces sp. NPDC059072 TaxID=3346715 RepID=UPI0036B5ACBA
SRAPSSTKAWAWRVKEPPRPHAGWAWPAFVGANILLFVATDLVLGAWALWPTVLNGLVLGTGAFALWRVAPGRR